MPLLGLKFSLRFNFGDCCKSQQSHNNLDPTTYQNGTLSGKTDFPRGYFKISRWRIFIFHVGTKKFFGGIK